MSELFSRSRLPVTLLAALCLAALTAGCGGGDGIRISAITATPSGDATPTETTDTTTIGAPGETPRPVAVPGAPDNPFAGGRLVEEYLAGGAARIEDCLPELVSRWEMAPSVDGPRCVSDDFDGDRLDEWVFLVSYASGAGDESPFPADLWFFEDETEDYRFFNSARALANAATAGLQVRGVDDMTGDGLPDLVMTWLECGAHTCITNVTIASYHNGILENLAPVDASIESLESFEIEGGAVRLEGGLIGSVGAGPQRPSTTLVRWAGSRFRVESEEGDPVYLVHLLNDADRLFAAAQYQEAQQLYLQASTDSALRDWKAELGEAPGRPELQAYATFRAAISNFRLDQAVSAVALLGQTVDRFPATMHAAAASQYLAGLDEGNDPAGACARAEAFVDSFRNDYVAFWNFGYANPERSVFTLCR